MIRFLLGVHQRVPLIIHKFLQMTIKKVQVFCQTIKVQILMTSLTSW